MNKLFKSLNPFSKSEPEPVIQHPFEMFTTMAPDVSSATFQVLRKMLVEAPTVPSRNGETKELNPHTIIIDGGGNPCTILPNRANNVIATVAETLWVWAGRNDVGSLTKWLPRAGDYSDDWNGSQGKWRAGYGPRIRSWNRRNGTTLDQLEVVVGRLQTSIDTRQALFTIYDPDDDSVPTSKDYPCNLIVHFLVRNDEVNMHTYLRSNDVIFGFCINSFEWVFIWDYIADKLNKGKGKYCHTASSLHLYGRHYDKAEKIVRSYREAPRFPYSASGLGSLSPWDLRSACDYLYSTAATQLPKVGTYPQRLQDFAIAMYSENALSSRDASTFVNLVSDISDLNLSLSLLELGQRRLNQPLYTQGALSLIFPVESDYGMAASFLKHCWDNINHK